MSADDRDHDDLGGLHWIAAGLFVAAGAEAALGERRGDYRTRPARWAPLVAAPLAAAAHAAHALQPSPLTRTLTRLANAAAIGIGAAGIASSAYSAWSEPSAPGEKDWTDRLPSFAPLAFAAIGLLGLILEDEEQEVSHERARLERRARVIERLVPKRRARLDHIILHM